MSKILYIFALKTRKMRTIKTILLSFMTVIALSAHAQEVADNDSVVSDSTVVLTSTLVIPNAFSPNNDRINDVFKAKSYQNIVEFHAYIFNRWGQKLYEWTNIDEGWDGTYRGKDVKQGTYFVLVKARGADGQTYNIRKDVNLLRGFSEGTSISQ
ncbi:MAG: gliding motility-associated C-terminal domain-containing protein [Prevotella sp.]|nr:gliding motility-associated C-terminal domain-containing protein [Prevotella sp.]